MTVDEAAFAKLMQEQKVRAREARKALGDLAWAGIDLGLDNTPTEFTGYEKDRDTAKVLALLAKDDETIVKAAEAMKANPAELVRKAEQTVAELKEARRVIEQYKAKESAGGADELLKKAEDVGGLHVTVQKLTQGDANSLRQLGDMLRDKDPAVVAVLALVGEKVTFQAVCGKEAVARGVKAGDIIKTIAPICGGRGGGKPDSAMGGGSDLEKVDQALAQVKALVAAKV